MTAVGIIPEGWSCERIQDAASHTANAIVGGPFGSDLISADYVAEGIPVIRGQNMSGSIVSGDFVFVSPPKARLLSANLAYSDDLIFTQRGTLGQVAIVPSNRSECYLVSQSQMKVSLNLARHDPSFVHQYFASRAGQKQIALSAIQTGVPHTNLGILRAYRFPAPPLSEQRAIAAALSDVDALLGGLDRLIAKKRDLKQAAMQQLLTGQTRLPGFNSKWEVKRLGKCANCFSGGTPPTGVASYYDGDIPWITSSDLNSCRITAVAGRISLEGLERSASRMIGEDTLLIALYGATSGVTAISKISAAINQAVLAIIPHQDDTSFLYFKLSSLKEWLIATYTQGGQPNLSGEIVKSLELQMPMLAEQVAIAAVLSDMDAELAALEARRDKTRALKEGMMQELLTGRTRLV